MVLRETRLCICIITPR